MKLERTKNTLKSSFWGVFNKAIIIIIQFAIRTIVIQKLGSEYLGLNSLFTSILNVLSLTELGFGAALVYSLYKPIADDNKTVIKAMLNLYRKFYKIVSVIILILGLSVLPFLRNLINTESWNNLDVNIYFIYLLFLLNTVLSYGLFAYKKSLLQAYQRNDVISNINSIVSIVLFSTQIGILLILENYYLYIMCIPFFTIIENIFTYVRVKNMFPDIKCEGKLEKNEIAAIYKTTGALMGHKLGTVVINSTDNIVISIFLNLTILAMFNNYYYVISALVVFIYIGYYAIIAGIGNSIITESIDKNYTLFKNLFFVISWIVGFCSVALLSLYQNFMELWMGRVYMFNIGTVILFALYFYLWQMRIAGLAFKDAAGMWRADVLKPYVSALFNVIFSIILVNQLGINGVVIASILAVSMISFPWETRVLFKYLFKRNSSEYIKRYFLYGSITLLSALITYYLSNLLPYSGIVGLLTRIGICLIVPNTIYILFYSRLPEFSFVLGNIKKFFKKS